MLKVPGYTEPVRDHCVVSRIPICGHADDAFCLNQVEFGALHTFSYRLADGSGEIKIATTRMETMLGDTAVAVNSEDPRYSKVRI